MLQHRQPHETSTIHQRYCKRLTRHHGTGVALGSGRHQSELPPTDVVHFMQNLHSFMWLWACGVFSVKIGLLLFYWRVFATRPARIANACIMALTVAMFLSIFFSFVFQCTPVSHFWNHEGPGTCIDQNSFYLAGGIMNVCSDLIVLGLPVPIVWGLHTSRNRKLSLTFLFGLGVL
jgi:hypothetical protein